MNRLAVNVCDLSELTRPPGSEFIVQVLVQDFIVPPHETVLIDRGQFDSGAAVLNGPAAQDEKRREAFILLLQTVIGPKKLGRPIRCYEETAHNYWEEIVPKKEKKHG